MRLFCNLFQPLYVARHRFKLPTDAAENSASREDHRNDLQEQRTITWHD